MTEFKMNNSKGENLTDWLYRNFYSYIYDNWLKQKEFELWDFVEKKYSEVWGKFINE